jgi:hypothetical protein
MTVPVTGERRDIGRLDGRRAVRRARFVIAAPMPAFVPSSSQRRGQLLLEIPTADGGAIGRVNAPTEWKPGWTPGSTQEATGSPG